MLGNYTVVFAASAGAAAALVGLIFVALTIDVGLEKEFRIKQYTLSETALISLGGIFVISLFALLPSGMLLMVGASIALSAFSICNIARIWILLRRKRRYAPDVLLPVDYVVGSATVGTYILLASTSLWVLKMNGTVGSLNTFCTLLVVLFVLSLVRVWRTLLIIRPN